MGRPLERSKRQRRERRKECVSALYSGREPATMKGCWATAIHRLVYGARSPKKSLARILIVTGYPHAWTLAKGPELDILTWVYIKALSVRRERDLLLLVVRSYYWIDTRVVPCSSLVLLPFPFFSRYSTGTGDATFLVGNTDITSHGQLKLHRPFTETRGR